jgi:tripartite-type tricarboxylate transporter receptor subunit TctC
MKLRLICATLAFAFIGGVGHAQDYPSRNIQIIVPFPAGGIVDAAARLIQPELEKRLGRSVLIDNRSGAGGAVGTQAVARAEADGHTLLVVASSHAVAPAVNPNLSYDTVKDFAPILMIARDPMLFVVNSKVPAKTLTEFVALARKEPGKLNYSSPGFGSQTQFIAELFNLKAGVKVTHVPFRGGAPALQALVQGDVDLSVLSGQVTLPQIEAGAIRALAVGGADRDQRSPNTQTIVEAGYPDVEAIQWVGIFAPAKTPEPIIRKLNATLNEILSDKGMKEKLAIQGMTALGGGPEVMGKTVEREVQLWKDVAKAANMKLAD